MQEDVRRNVAGRESRAERREHLEGASSVPERRSRVEEPALLTEAFVHKGVLCYKWHR